MQLTGEMLIGARAVKGTHGEVRAVNPATGAVLEPVFGGGSAEDVEVACGLAGEAFDVFRLAPLEVRAKLLESIAQGLVDAGDALVERVMAESGLPRPRVEGERGRTVGQLRLFASVVRDGRWLEATLDTPLPDRKPLARADLRAQKIPVGAVAVFGASNFPLAFSVAGGDTASALAAGCPVVAKAHPSHLGTSEMVGRVIQQAVAESGLPEGVFSLLIDNAENSVAAALVQHPEIQAVGFTGSRRVGRVLVGLAAGRANPIPVFAEMSSINPVFLLPAALAARAETIGQGLIDSVTLGVGQFCTKPGLAIGVAGADFERFCSAAQAAVAGKAASTMLNAGIHKAFCHGTGLWKEDAGVHALAVGGEAVAGAGQASLFRTTAGHSLTSPHLLEEVFGPATLLIECSDQSEMLAVARYVDGQLTATMHMEDADTALARRLLTVLERKAGRVLLNGFPTGVEVSYAMVHGGPSPATSDSRVTSVGAMAIERFLRPVCYQDLPQELLPPELRDTTRSYRRLVNGEYEEPT